MLFALLIDIERSSIMSLLATTTLAALLVANPASTDADRIAANGGFLLGNARRCGISEDRIVNASKIVHELIVAATGDGKDAEDATMRYATFFVVSAYPNQPKEKVLANCKTVANELQQFEQHKSADPQNAPQAAVVGSDGPPKFRVSDGE